MNRKLSSLGVAALVASVIIIYALTMNHGSGHDIKVSQGIILEESGSELEVFSTGPKTSIRFENDDPTPLTYRVVVRNIANNSIVQGAEYKALDGANLEFNIKVQAKQDRTVSFFPLEEHNDMRFLVIGDNQGHLTTIEEMLDHARTSQPIFILHLGDITPSGTQEQFDEYIQLIQESPVPIYHTPGNHDIRTSCYSEYFGNGNYTFTWAHTLFISLDTSSAKLTDEQMLWLESLDMETNWTKVLFTHMPFQDPRPSSYHSITDNASREWLENWILENNVELYLSGHVHMYDLNISGNTTLVTSGGGGADLVAPENEGGFYHFLDIHSTSSGFQIDTVELTPPPRLLNVTVHSGSVSMSFDIEKLRELPLVQAVATFQNRYDNWAKTANYSGVKLCDLVEQIGEMGQDEVLKVTAFDGYSQMYSYDNVYPNQTFHSLQGDIVLAYSMDGKEVPEWEEGPRIVFLSQDGQYSNEDAYATTEPEMVVNGMSGGTRWVREVVSIEIFQP